jgi:hypothetical protein
VAIEALRCMHRKLTPKTNVTYVFASKCIEVFQFGYGVGNGSQVWVIGNGSQVLLHGKWIIIFRSVGYWCTNEGPFHSNDEISCCQYFSQ